MQRTRLKDLLFLSALVGMAVLVFLSERRYAGVRSSFAALEERHDSLMMEFQIVNNERVAIRSEYDGALEDLRKTNPELEQRLKEQRKAAEDARRKEAEAIRERRNAERSQEAEQQARELAEESQAMTQEALDSLEREKRETDRLNRQKDASLVAQNSMNIKGDPQLRGLMAAYALQTLESSGGDVNNQEVVDALKGALDVLQVGREPGVEMDKVARFLLPSGRDGLLAMGDDGRVFDVAPLSGRRSMGVDLSAQMDRLTGKAFLTAVGEQVVLADAEGVRLHAARDGRLLAAARRTPHKDRVRAAARIGGDGVLATGDLEGVLAIWRQQGDDLELMAQHAGRGKFRSLMQLPGGPVLMGIDGSPDITLIHEDGSLSQLRLPGGERAWSMSPAGPGTVLVGTVQGSIWKVGVEGAGPAPVRRGKGQQVEALCGDPTTGAVAWVDKNSVLTVVGRSEAAMNKEFRMQVPQIPNAMCFGMDDMLYLSTSSGIRPVLCTSRSMARRICELVGRSWTQEEWRQHVGQGPPAPTCADF